MDNLFKSLEQVKEEQDREMQIENNMSILKKELYYQPEIEEFHIGFQYEQELNNYNWRKMVRPPSDNFEWVKFEFNTSTSLSKIQKEIKEEKIRVKYLDTEDLENLGFIEKLKKPDYFTSPKKPTDSDYHLLFSFKDGVLKLGGIHGIAFHVKNKNELKKLCKQLDIL